jgi:hypothetical protein
VHSLAGAVALVGVGPMRAGQLGRNDDSESWGRKIRSESSLENVEWGFLP